MRVVIVGATGNVGTSLALALAADPEVSSVVGVARRWPEWHLPKTRWVAADITTDDLAEVMRGADAVVHLAWLLQPTHDPVKTWQTNVVGSERVFRAVADADVPVLVYASSVGAYSPGRKDRAVDESWPTDGWPTAAYTREKAYVERMLDTYELQHQGRRVVRMRPGFIFKRESASQQRRLFLGPLLPHRLVDTRRIPVMPDIKGLRFQVLHSSDAAEAYQLALHRPVRGAFNLAADPVVDGEQLAELTDARRTGRLPAGVARSALAAAWHMHLVPASPQLFDALVHLPVMDTARARDELGWRPRYTALEVLREFVDGLHDAAAMETPPLARHAGGPARTREVGTGVGTR